MKFLSLSKKESLMLNTFKKFHELHGNYLKRQEKNLLHSSTILTRNADRKLKRYGCEITTLEEVFLKIGHGDEDDEEGNIEKIRLKMANSENLTEQDKILTDYSVSTD
ncbi:MAG UNVERIFIED_CONTAM: hypothetical protein LVR29_20430 [Microcystis novacekii LVE1205-3]|jgi:hypothetical protein